MVGMNKVKAQGRLSSVMDTSSCQSEDPLSFATQPELNDASAEEDDQLPSQNSSPTTTWPLADVQNDKYEMNQQTYYTQESDDSSRKISTPATRSTATSVNVEAEALMSSDDDEDPTIGLSLMQKRAQNEQRNQAFLSRIGLEYGMKPASKGKAPKRKPTSSPSKGTVEIEKRGMLLSTHHDMRVGNNALSGGKPLLSDIFLQFPFRESEITKLTGYLEAGAAQIKNTFVPFPAIVTGPAGVGKTAVVRACVDFLKRTVNGKEQAAVVLDSYVNCSALDEPSIDVLARKMYRQLANNLVESGEYGNDQRGQFISTMMSENDDLPSQDYEFDSTTNQPTTKRSQKKKSSVSLGREINHGTGTSSTSVSVWNLGCDLKRLLQGNRCGVLVLDNAERILTMNSGKGSDDRVNFLSQILLLPQLLELNLSIIVISKSLLLEYSRLHVAPSVGTLGDYFQPLHFHFSAYRDKTKIKRILSSKHAQSMILGYAKQAERNNAFVDKLYEAFLENIINSLHDITVDVREYTSICRSLWSQYLEPLRKSNIQRTLRSAIGSSTEMQVEAGQVISIVDKKFQPRLRVFMEKGLSASALTLPDTGGDRLATAEAHDLSIMAKYLLLAAFLCQMNSPDRDKELLSIEKNGKRRRNSGHRDDDEENAFGSNVEESKSLQRRYFPAERMFSVYTSIVTNVDNSIDSTLSREKRGGLQAVESMAFYNNISFLREIGLLHEHGQRQHNDTIYLRDPKYSCPLTKEDAKSIATTINFPLGRFMK